MAFILSAAIPAAAENSGLVIWGRQWFDVREFTKPFTKIAAGSQHTVAIRNNGTVVAWGGNHAGQAEVPAGLSGVTAVTAGASHTVALKSDGTVVAWGEQDISEARYGQTNVPDGLTGVLAIAAGAFHTVALKNDGSVVAWGSNAYGQSKVPEGLSGVVAIAAGQDHTLALKNDGTVVAWGANHFDQSTVPDGLTGIVAIAAGTLHSIALKDDGTVVAWGDFHDGRTMVPEGLSGVVAITAGYNHSLALKNDGTVIGWGMNSSGQTTAPAGLSGIVAIAAGGSHSVALKGDGTVVAWGNNSKGQALVPDAVNEIVAVAARDSTTVALKKNGTVIAWSDYGARSVPAELNGVVAISAGSSHGLALKNDQTVVGWGSNFYGQTEVPPGLEAVAIAAGGEHSVALTKDGEMVAWGRNHHGQTAVPPGLGAVTAIAAGRDHTLALRSDGTVVAWGKNDHRQATVPEGLSGVVAIAAGDVHTVALKNDGTVVTWGSNTYGQAAVPAGLDGVIEIAAGSLHTVALKNDGTVVSWGRTPFGPITKAVELSGVAAIAAGEAHGIALVLPPAAPSVTTGLATDITTSAATLRGTVTANGAAATITFEYGNTQSYGNTVPALPDSVPNRGTVEVSLSLDNLQSKTIYYYRVVATSAAGATYGETGTFTTLNTIPVVGADAVSTLAGRIKALNVLANDADEDGDSLTVIKVTPGQHGTVAMRGGRIFYTPDPGFSGEDTFTYTISDGFGGTATGTVTVTVPERPQDPVATLLSAKGQPVPGAGVEGSGTEALPVGSTWATFGAPAINGAGQLAFAATVRAGKATHAGIFTYDAEEGGYTLVARKGDAVAELPGAVFASLKDPVLDEAGRVAFVATLSGAGVKKASNGAIFTTAYGDLQLIARKGDQPPGAPEGAKWTSFQSLALPDGVAGPLFVGKMTGNRRSGITPANDVGLWGADSNGTVRPLLQEGQAIEGRKLKSFVVLSSVASVTGQTRSFNKAGELIVRAHFTDGSQGLVTVQIP